MAKMIRVWATLRARVAPGFHKVRRRNVVHVIARHAHCDRARLALRARGQLYILNTARGQVYVKGRPGRNGRENQRGGRGPLRALALVTRDYWFDTPDRAKRLLVRCPRKRYPLGGGMVSTPTLSADGEGVYPHSYERLGVQRGYHVTALVIDPTPHETTPRQTTIQVVCGRGLVPRSSPRRTVFVRRNETNTAVASCPRGQYLFSGGFQRTNFTTPFVTFGGNYITESRAVSPTAWQVTATSVGDDGGELTAIAHCAKSKLPLITEVSNTVPLPGNDRATATTPPCPPGLRLTAGGFSFGGFQRAFFAEGHFDAAGTWSTTGFGYFGESSPLTAYGYCLKVSGRA
jgi:hypothetical protein